MYISQVPPNRAPNIFGLETLKLNKNQETR